MFKKSFALLIMLVALFTITVPVSAATNIHTPVDAQKISICDVNRTFDYLLPLDEIELYENKTIKNADYRVFFDEEDKSYIIEFDLTFDDDDNVQVGIREVPGEYNLIYRCNQNLQLKFKDQYINVTKI